MVFLCCKRTVTTSISTVLEYCIIFVISYSKTVLQKDTLKMTLPAMLYAFQLLMLLWRNAPNWI
jgi:hypothetical protein